MKKLSLLITLFFIAAAAHAQITAKDLLAYAKCQDKKCIEKALLPKGYKMAKAGDDRIVEYYYSKAIKPDGSFTDYIWLRSEGMGQVYLTVAYTNKAMYDKLIKEFTSMDFTESPDDDQTFYHSIKNPSHLLSSYTKTVAGTTTYFLKITYTLSEDEMIETE